jgi:acetyl esterase
VLSNLRKRVGSKLIEGFFAGSANIARLHPRARPGRHNVEVLRNIPYQQGLHLDVYRPLEARAKSPALLYVHGGGFRILSKDTHWVMGLAFAKRGYTVFSIDYRLAPAHPYPAALEDTCAAYSWVLDHAHEYGASAEGLVLAGESAGANLVTALTLAICSEREEPWARQAFAHGNVPAAVIPFCGMFQVSNVARLWQSRHISRFVRDRLEEVERGYIGNASTKGSLIDPLHLIESDQVLHRPLPPFFLSVGTRDPLLDDSERLAAALTRRAVPHELHVYPREFHAFQAFVMRKHAKQCWADMDAFLAQHAPKQD